MLFKLLCMSIDNPDLVQREADLLSLHFESTPMVIHRLSGLSFSPCSQLAIRISLLWYKGALINWVIAAWPIKNSISLTSWQLSIFWHWRRWRARGKSQKSWMWQVHGWKCRLGLSIPFPVVCVGGVGRRSSSSVTVWQQQKFYGHPILFIPAKRSVTCAGIPTYIPTYILIHLSITLLS
jgi:hypothetical protein